MAVSAGSGALARVVGESANVLLTAGVVARRVSSRSSTHGVATPPPISSNTAGPPPTPVSSTRSTGARKSSATSHEHTPIPTSPMHATIAATNRRRATINRRAVAQTSSRDSGATTPIHTYSSLAGEFRDTIRQE